METVKCAEQSGVSTGSMVPKKEDFQLQVGAPTPSPDKDILNKPTVVYAAENTDFYMGTTPALSKQEPHVETVFPDHYLWKKKLCVSVHRLSDFEISYWSGGFNQDTDEHPIKMETSPVKGHDGPETRNRCG